MADHGLTAESAEEMAGRLTDEVMTYAQIEGLTERGIAMAGIRYGFNAARAQFAPTREDNAPESIAHEVIARRYGSLSTFEHALYVDPPHPLGILNMLKDAAAAGLDSREEF